MSGLQDQLFVYTNNGRNVNKWEYLSLNMLNEILFARFIYLFAEWPILLAFLSLTTVPNSVY